MATTTTTIYYDEDDEDLPVYPAEDYESWISVEDADYYMQGRLNSYPWFSLELDLDRASALRTAFRALEGLDIALDELNTISRDKLLRALQQAQCEQALHELKRDLDAQQALDVSIGGLLSAKFSEKKRMDRFSERAIAMLRPCTTLPSVKRFR